MKTITKGSEKQIAWAQDIMAGVEHWVKQVETGMYSNDIIDEEREVISSIVAKIRENILTLTDAKTIIDHRDKVKLFDKALSVTLRKAGYSADFILAAISSEANRQNEN